MSDRLHDAAAVTLERLQDWHRASADTLRLRCGELSTEEVRLIRAVLNAIVGRDSPAVLRAGESSSTDGGRTWIHDKSGEAAGFEPVTVDELPPGYSIAARPQGRYRIERDDPGGWSVTSFEWHTVVAACWAHAATMTDPCTK